MKDLIIPSGFLILLIVLIAGTMIFQPVTAATIQANVMLSPEKINLSNPAADFNNPYMTAEISFSGADRKKITQVDPSTVLLDNTIPLFKYTRETGKFKAFFDKDVVISYLWTKVYHLGYLPPFKNVPVVLTVTGNLYDGTLFTGSDTVYLSAR